MPLLSIDAADAPSPAGGVIRGARRPVSWQAPGPSPAIGVITPDLWPGPDEDLCWLAGNWRILQRVDGHRFSLDDLLTAWLAAATVEPRPPTRLLDLGCGIGTVLLFLAWRFPEAWGVGVEAQTLSAGMARRSVRWNGVEGRIRVVDGDLRDQDVVPHEYSASFDLVTGTPPYFPRGTGLESEQVQKGPCRFEFRGGIEDYAAAAARQLAVGAPFVACGPSPQEARIRSALSEAGLRVERWMDVIPRAGKPPLIAVFVARRYAEAGGPEERWSLTVRERDGQWSPAFREVRREMGFPP